MEKYSNKKGIFIICRIFGSTEICWRVLLNYEAFTFTFIRSHMARVLSVTLGYCLLYISTYVYVRVLWYVLLSQVKFCHFTSRNVCQLGRFQVRWPEPTLNWTYISNEIGIATEGNLIICDSLLNKFKYVIISNMTPVLCNYT